MSQAAHSLPRLLPTRAMALLEEEGRVMLKKRGDDEESESGGEGTRKKNLSIQMDRSIKITHKSTLHLCFSRCVPHFTKSFIIMNILNS
jgi:hypothetical protein